MLAATGKLAASLVTHQHVRKHGSVWRQPDRHIHVVAGRQVLEGQQKQPTWATKNLESVKVRQAHKVIKKYRQSHRPKNRSHDGPVYVQHRLGAVSAALGHPDLKAPTTHLPGSGTALNGVAAHQKARGRQGDSSMACCCCWLASLSRPCSSDSRGLWKASYGHITTSTFRFLERSRHTQHLQPGDGAGLVLADAQASRS